MKQHLNVTNPLRRCSLENNKKNPHRKYLSGKWKSSLKKIKNKKKKQRCQLPLLQPVAELWRSQRGEIGRQDVKAPLAAALIPI